ncbi:MAG: type III-B CRISPR module RAMP protein Cmr4 [Streptosporangiaceae bacterium]
MTEYLLYLYAESPVHTGAADSLDLLDLPVQREAATGYPVIWGQSLKGALRQAAGDHPDWDRDLVEAVFGSAPGERGENGGTTRGLLAVGDAQLVAMPVPTLHSTFAWLTSEIALGRLGRKYAAVKQDDIPAVPEVAPDSGLAAHEAWTHSASGGEILGPYVLSLGAGPDPGMTTWAGRLAADAVLPEDPEDPARAGLTPFADKLRRDLVLAGSDIVPPLLRECTEQAVRVQLSATSKTVENGPFYSEYLPAETILAASLTLRQPRGGDAAARHEEHRSAVRALLRGGLLQVGGDETLGKGLVWCRLLEEGQPR